MATNKVLAAAPSRSTPGIPSSATASNAAVQPLNHVRALNLGSPGRWRSSRSHPPGLGDRVWFARPAVSFQARSSMDCCSVGMLKPVTGGEHDSPIRIRPISESNTTTKPMRKCLHSFAFKLAMMESENACRRDATTTRRHLRM